MTRPDPTDADPPYRYECVECGHRLESESRPQRCPECGGSLQNISVPRE